MPVLVPDGPAVTPPAPPNTGICSPWAAAADVCGPCIGYDLDPALLDDALQVASEILYDLTRRRWPGECADTVRPCGERHDRAKWYPTHRTVPVCGCRSSRECGCRRLSEIRLPGYPVTSIGQVTIDGDIIDPANYRVDDWRYLTWLDPDGETGRGGWPCCADPRRGIDEDDSFSVTYTYGLGPPLGGVQAAATLGCQLALACVPDAKCQLPKRITTITRSGVSLAVLDPLSLFKDGLTGIASVDLWVASTFLGSARRPATVVVPGRGRPVRRHTSD